MSYFGNHFSNYGGGWWGSLVEQTIFFLRGSYDLIKEGLGNFNLIKAVFGNYEEIMQFSGTYSLNLIQLSGQYEPTIALTGVYE